MCDYIYSINIYEQFYDPNDAKSKIALMKMCVEVIVPSFSCIFQ